MQVKGPGGTGTLSGAFASELGDAHSCVVKSDTSVWCWGLNNKGQLGDNTTTDQLAPVQVKGPGGTGTLTGVDSVAAGLQHTCGVKSDGTMWCWGLNNKGQLGDNTTTDRPAPVQVTDVGGVGTITDATTGATGSVHTCVADTSAWCWGDNPDGQLGDGTTDQSPVPVQVI